MKQQKALAGFTLVELAVSMIIIGLLIGGVLKGQELINNSKMSALAGQVNSIQAALNTFRDSYRSLPGDMVNARSRLVNCTASLFCENGDGNQLIYGSGDGSTVSLIAAYTLGESDVGSEQAQFFKHLAIADLMIGIDPASADVAWGKLYPASKLGGGGFTIQNVSYNGDDSPGGLVLRLHSNFNSNIEGDLGKSALTSTEAGFIDKKLDDGVPFTGWVTSTGYGNPAHCEEEYDGSTTKDCTLLFSMN